MTRSQLVDALATRRNLPRRTAEEVVQTVFMAMRDALLDGDRVEIRGFGSLKVKRYAGYLGRNPRTGESLQVAPKVLPVFRISKGLHNRLNKALESE